MDTLTGLLTAAYYFIDNIYVSPNPLVGIDKISYNMSNVFPNPTTGQVNIQTPQQFGQTKTLEIFDCVGQKQFVKTNDFTEIDLSSLTSGLYFIVLTNKDNERQTIKIIKE
jgi:hypothetical protein